MTTAIAEATETILKIEREACSRCGANPSAFAVFSDVNAGRCFKCNGSLTAYTRAGAKIATMLQEWRNRPMNQLAVGDRVIYRQLIMLGAGQLAEKRGVWTVAAVGLYPSRQYSKGATMRGISGQGVPGTAGWVRREMPVGDRGVMLTRGAEIDFVFGSWGKAFDMAKTGEEIQAFLQSIRFVGKRDRKGIVEVPAPEKKISA